MSNARRSAADAIDAIEEHLDARIQAIARVFPPA
jgi:hypothetical protein